MIVVVSDIHLAEKQKESEKCPEEKLKKLLSEDDRQFVDFLREIKNNQLSNGGDLVLLGDVVDFWRRDFSKALRECGVIFSELMSFDHKKVNIHYVVGNHDYYMLQLKKNLLNGPHFSNVAKSVRLSSGDEKFFFIHGYQLETLANPYYKSQTSYEEFAEHLCLAGDDIGSAASTLWNLWTRYKNRRFKEKQLKRLSLKRWPKHIKGALDSMMERPDVRLTGRYQARSLIEELAISEARSVYLGMKRNEVLVFGHTHKPFQCPLGNKKAAKVVNTGSWKKSPCDYYSFVVIDEGEIQLKQFIDGKIRDRTDVKC